MSRIIKFRGYSIKDKKWIDGDLQHYNDSLAIIPFEANWLDEIITPSKLLNKSLQVDPESIGQFTGLYDKNGVEIYIGDILATSNENPLFDIWTKKDHGYTQVMENPTELGFTYSNWSVETDNHQEDKACLQFIEVIGNLHQNPELLK